jgi:REP element-mobilizing transposase RayT
LDRQCFLNTLGEACEKTGWEIHACVLMGNHDHLLLRAPAANLVADAPEKVALAWWLRRRTTVSLRWGSGRLGMGHYTRVTQAVGRRERRPGRRLAQLQRQLLRLNGEDRA